MACIITETFGSETDNSWTMVTTVCKNDVHRRLIRQIQGLTKGLSAQYLTQFSESELFKYLCRLRPVEEL